MPFFRSVCVVILIVITSGCALSEKLDDKDRTSQSQTTKHFEFIEHSTVPAAGSLYNIHDIFVGSCVLVAPTVALTAGHCIEMGSLKYARFGEEEIMIEVQCLHKDYIRGDDIGLLILKTESKHEPMAMVDNICVIPQMYPLYTIAHGEGKKKISKEEIFHYYGVLTTKQNEIIFLPIKTSVWFGDSGGALIYKDNDDKNVLIGIITHFSVMDGQIYECAARRTDNFNIYDDILQPWIAK